MGESDGVLARREALQPESPAPAPALDSPPSSIGTPGSEEPDVPEEPAGPPQPGMGACVQPAVVEHVSVVHASPSSQLPQLVHALAPGVDAYVPGAHGVQTVSDAGVHADEAWAPAGQTAHALHVPSSRKKPLGHVPQSDAAGPEHVAQLAWHAAQTVSVVAVQAADG